MGLKVICRGENVEGKIGWYASFEKVDCNCVEKRKYGRKERKMRKNREEENIKCVEMDVLRPNQRLKSTSKM